jgi:hypothetical protein
MPAKIRKRLMGLQFSELAKPRFFRMVDKFIKELIVSTIKKGISPVNQKTAIEKNTGGKSRYQEYSESYINQMGKGSGALKNKKRTPRNLELTGKMLKSIKSRKFKNYLKVRFSDKKAKYHNDEGAGKSKVIRRMLPKDGEDFSRNIQNKIVETLAKAIKSVIK